MSLLMSDNLRATEAIKVVHTVDTVIWKQKRHLPLELDKAYTNTYAKVKKLTSQRTDSLETILEEPAEDDQLNLLEKEQGIEQLGETSSQMSDEVLKKVTKLNEVMKEKIEVRQKEKLYTLPEPKCVRQNHNLLAVHCEAKVAEEILDKKCFLMPDGTYRQGVWDIAASVVKVGDKDKGF